MPNITQNSDGSQDWDGADHNGAGYIPVTFNYTASSVDQSGFVAPRAFVIKSIIGRPTVAGTDAGAVTGVVRVAPSGTAIASGTAAHSGSYDLKGTVHTNQPLTVSAGSVAAGSSIGIDFTGVLTAAVGSITVMLAPA